MLAVVEREAFHLLALALLSTQRHLEPEHARVRNAQPHAHLLGHDASLFLLQNQQQRAHERPVAHNENAAAGLQRRVDTACQKLGLR